MGAGTIIAVDWGAPFAPKRPRPHVAAAKASGVRVVEFRHVAELTRKVPAPAVVFAEAAGPYLELCELSDVYSVYCVDTRLVAEYRRANNVKKSDEDDARTILAIAEDYLSGRLSEGVWPFAPDELRRALREADRLFRCYQKLRAICPERAEELKREWRGKVREVENLARKDEDCREFVQYLNGFGEHGTSVAQAIAELRGKRFSNFERLYQYARKNRGLWKAVSALAEMITRNKGRSEKAKKIVEQLGSDPRYGGNLKNRLKKWLLVRAAWAAGALPRR